MKTESLYSVVYISGYDPQLKASELASLDLAQYSKMRITGCFAIYKGNVVQVLEGNIKVINNIYQQIAANPNHKNLTQIWNGTIKNRNFSKYQLINFGEMAPSTQLDQRALIEFKIKSLLNNHEKNLAQSIFLETLKQIS